MSLPAECAARESDETSVDASGARARVVPESKATDLDLFDWVALFSVARTARSAASGPIFFEIDQELAEGSRCWTRPEFADAFRTVKVRQHQYVECGPPTQTPNTDIQSAGRIVTSNTCVGGRVRRVLERSAPSERARVPTIPELEQLPSQRLDALPLAARAELLHVLMLPDFERVARIGEFWSYPQSRTLAERLIDYRE